MSSEPVISLHNVNKTYRAYDHPMHGLISRISGGRIGRYKEFHALKDISFDVYKGETVGIIGRNGSGKSTVLQIICGIRQPTTGNVSVKGRISALLELGSGFNPEFTGRENVYINAALLGMHRKEIDERFNDIATFADIGEFIEQPVKTYSSGMLIRLAFAVNILSNPDIMIVDEALSVGDMNFQAKCMTALTHIQESGATVLFVSHDIGALKSLCSRGIYLERGSIRAIGKAPDVAELYVQMMREEMNAECRKFVRVLPETECTQTKKDNMQQLKKSKLALKRSDEFDKRVALHRYGSGGARITYVELLNMNDELIQLVEFNQEVKIRIHVESSSAQSISVNFYIRDDKKVNLTGCGFTQAGQKLLTTEIDGQYLVEYILRLPLQEGSYSLLSQITSPVLLGKTARFLDVIEDAVVFQILRCETVMFWSKIHLFPILSLKKLS